MDEVSLKSLENLTTLQNKFQTLANQALLNGSAGNGLATTKRETRVCIEELSQQLFFLGTHTLDVLDKQTQEVDTLDVKLSSVHTHMKIMQEVVSLEALAKECSKQSPPLQDFTLVSIPSFPPASTDLSTFTIHTEMTPANIANFQINDITQLMPTAMRPTKRGQAQSLPTFSFQPPPSDIPLPPPSDSLLPPAQGFNPPSSPPLDLPPPLPGQTG